MNQVKHKQTFKKRRRSVYKFFYVKFNSTTMQPYASLRINITVFPSLNNRNSNIKRLNLYLLKFNHFTPNKTIEPQRRQGLLRVHENIFVIRKNNEIWNSERHKMAIDFPFKSFNSVDSSETRIRKRVLRARHARNEFLSINLTHISSYLKSKPMKPICQSINRIKFTWTRYESLLEQLNRHIYRK